MKILLAATLLMISSTYPPMVNQPERIVIDGHVTFKQTFESELTRSELMQKATAWVEKKYEVLKNPIQLQDDENGLLVVNGIDVYLYEVVLKDAPKRKNRENQNNSSVIHFQLTIEAKDAEIEMTMTEIKKGNFTLSPYLDEDLAKNNEARSIERKINELFFDFSKSVTNTQ